MPEQHRWEEPERLLVGSDRPRPLPPALRSRLEEVLIEGEAGAGRPLPASTRSRLQGRLAARQRWRKWSALGVLGAAAAAVVAVALVAAPGGPSHRVATPSVSKPAAAPLRKGPLRLGSSLRASSRPAFLPRALSKPSAAVVSVIPREGPARGGNWVVVKGYGVGNAGEVYFGQVPAARVERVSAVEVRALAPAHSPGTVVVSVRGRAVTAQAAARAPRTGGARLAEPTARVGATGANASSTATAGARYTFSSPGGSSPGGSPPGGSPPGGSPPGGSSPGGG